MRVWIVTIGETLPGSKDRLHRSGILARYLVDQGHSVVWWGSAFDHFTKRHHFPQDSVLNPSPGLRMVLFHSCGYRRNISFARMKDHRQLAAKFHSAATAETERPDIILSSFPTIELCVEAVRYGKKHGIPVVLDVRDLWPDIFVNVAPKPLRPLVRLPLHSLFRQTREAFQGATGLIGISPAYLDWGLRYATRSRKSTDGVFPLGYRKNSPSPEQLSAAKDSILKLGVDPLKTIAWFVGTFGRTYDLTPALETARAFQKQGRKNVQFVFSGSGENEAAYRALAQGLENTVFTGWMDSGQLAYLLSIARLGMAAYAAGAPQGLPNKFFEYLSEGIPVLSSLEGEAAEVLRRENCGVSYRAGDAIDFARQLETALLEPESLQKMGLRGKALFEKEYSADVIYPKLVRFLESAALARPETTL